MTWRDVLDSDKFPFAYLPELIDFVVDNKLGYKFFAWNGMVFFLHGKDYFETGIETKNLR